MVEGFLRECTNPNLIHFANINMYRSNEVQTFLKGGAKINGTLGNTVGVVASNPRLARNAEI